MWANDYATGILICAVCGAEKGDRKSCCKTAPYVGFEEFCKRYFGKSLDEVAYSTRRDFYDDYRHSDCRSLAAYIKQTTSELC